MAALEATVEPDTIILDTTTGDPADVDWHAERFAGRGVSYLDCEIGGSSKQAAAGEAIVICGGDADAFASLSRYSDAISLAECFILVRPARGHA